MTETMLALLTLVTMTTLLGLLPFLPAVVELLRKTDATPLRIIREHDGNIRHFAHRCRAQVHAHLSEMARAEARHWSAMRAFSEGTPFHLIPGAAIPARGSGSSTRQSMSTVLFSLTARVLPERSLWAQEIYAAENVWGGDESVYRALLGERDLFLGRGSNVLHWMHSERDTYVDRNSTLHGRASAGRLLRLAEGCRFERLHAPRIEFGSCPTSWSDPAVRSVLAPEQLVLPNSVDAAGRRWIVRGNLAIPPGSCFDGDLVVTGWLRVGEGSRIAGSLKSYQQMLLGPGTRIEGSVVSSQSLSVGSGSWVKGPVIAEKEVVLEAGSRLGTPQQPTSVTAPRISIVPGVVAFGTVWAREAGWVDAHPGE